MKVDTNTIEGFESMSAEDKVNALLGYEFPEAAESDGGEVERLKKALTNANAEAAGYKRQLRERLTDEEARAAQVEEERNAMREELESLRKERMIGELKSFYMDVGYDADSAAKSAEALHKGDYKSVFAAQKAFVEAQRKAAAASAMDNQPKLTSGDPVSSDSVADKFEQELRRFAGLSKK